MSCVSVGRVTVTTNDTDARLAAAVSAVDVGAPLSAGIYSFPQAAAIVGRHHQATEGQLRRWLAVVFAPDSTGRLPETISFHDLVSLETVRRFRACGASLQKVRKVLEALRGAHPEMARPLVHRSFFTDGRSVWAGDAGDAAEEIVGRHRCQMALEPAVARFADEIRFVEDVAAAWDISPWVGIDPKICFGAPVVRGTRIPVRTIMANLAEETEQEVADWYELSVCQVRGVAEFAA